MSALTKQSEKKNVVNVDRDDILEGGIRAFQRNSFKPNLALSVRFAAEDGIDSGGLMREFMRLAMKAIQQYRIFEGDENKRLLALDYICKHFIIIIIATKNIRNVRWDQ